MANDTRTRRQRERWTLVAAILGSSIVFLDSTVVNVALPRIGRELPSALFGALEGQTYVYIGYLLTLSALLVLAGALNDYYGRRRTFFLGLIGFGLASILCGLAPTMELLILFRILQGAAGALLVPGSLALLTSTFEGEARGRAFGLWAGASAATSILGPFVGGVLVQTVSWRAAFLLNVPLVVIAAWATWAHIVESRDEEASRQFDWPGAAVIFVAIGGLAFGAVYGQQRDWHEPLAFAALALGAGASMAFPFLMARRPHPLVPLSLFRSRTFSVANLSTLLIYGALYVTAYYQSLFTQGTLGYSAASAGILGLPGGLLLAIFSSRVGALGARIGPRRFMTAGPLIMAVGLLWLARIPADSAPWVLRPGDLGSFVPPPSYFVDLFPASILFGIGLAILVAPLTTAVMSSVPVRNSGLASAINNAISRVGPQLAGALIFVAITASFYSSLASQVPGIDVSAVAIRQAIPPLNPPAATVSPAIVHAARQASTDAFHLAMLVAAGLLVAGAAISAVGIQDPAASTSSAGEAQEAAPPV